MALSLAVALLALQPPDDAATAAEVAKSLENPRAPAADTLRRALRELSKSSSLWRALRVIHAKRRDWQGADAVARHLRAHPPAKTAEALLASLRTLVPADEIPAAVRWLALAHVDELAREGKEAEALREFGPRLGIGRIQAGIVDTEGELVWQLKDHVDAGTAAQAFAMQRYRRAEFAVAYARAVAGFHAAAQNRDLWDALSRDLRALKKSSPEPEHIEALARIARDLVPCRQCRGEGKRECATCGGTGERKLMCSACDGAGRIFKGVSARTGRPVIEPCSSCNSRGKWTEKCAICEASGRAPCRSCAGPHPDPSFAELFDREPCASCGETGSIFERLKIPCPFCFGWGAFFIPKDRPKARLPIETD